MKYIILFLLFFHFSFANSFDHEYKDYDLILKKYVLNGRVDYKSLKENQTEINSILKLFSGLSLKDYNQFTKNEKMAFLINAYNIFTIDLILKNYPVKSIKDIKSSSLFNFLDNPWKIEFFNLLGQKRYLDWIEHDILRKKFKNPRIHFALVCASKSCPILINEPYIPYKLEKQLNNSAVKFLSNKNRNYYNPKTKTLFLSKIFDWYEEDFLINGSLIYFLQPYFINLPPDVNIEYLEYDWDLNQKE